MSCEIYTVEQVAEKMQVNYWTVLRWINSGKLKASKIGRRTYRIMEEDLLAFLKAHKTN